MNRHLHIWGAGGHGKVVLDTALCCGEYASVSFVEDDVQRHGGCFCGLPVLGSRELANRAGDSFVIAIGCNRTRRRCFNLALDCGLVPATLVHPAATVAASASIGRGTLLMPGVVVNADAVIGDNCILNTGAIVEHDCVIGDDVHLSPRSVLGGRVIVENFAHVGIGAVLLPDATVGFGAVVGGGAVVLKQAPAHCTVVGVPAKSLVFE